MTYRSRRRKTTHVVTALCQNLGLFWLILDEVAKFKDELYAKGVLDALHSYYHCY